MTATGDGNDGGAGELDRREELAQGVDPLQDQIVWSIRTPRVLLAAVVGAALATAGVALQGLVRNPLADPYVQGISSGASLGAVLVLVLGFGSAAVAGLSVSGSLLAVFLLAQRSGQLTDNRLVLAGVALGYLTMAGTSLVQLRSDPSEIRGILFWLMGSVAAAAMLACTVALLLRARDPNALAVGDDNAAALGVDVHRLRIGLLLVSSLLTAVAVAVAGGIGFVGLMVPHAVRLVAGSDHRRLLPLAALNGAVYLVLVDLVSRVVDRPNEYPFTVFTAALGAPFFLWLLRAGPGRS